MFTRKRIDVQGIVQGVGFRPYVFRLAVEAGLAGEVSNTAAGATIEVEGSVEAVANFLRRLPAELPPLAVFAQMMSPTWSAAAIPDFKFCLAAARRVPRP